MLVLLQVKYSSGDCQTIECSYLVNGGGPWAADLAQMGSIGDKDHKCSAMRVNLPVKPRIRSVFVVRCPAGPISDCPLVIDGDIYFRRDSDQTFLAGWSPPKVRFYSRIIIFFFLFLHSCHMKCSFLLHSRSSSSSSSSSQHMDSDADGVNLDVDHSIFEKHMWPKLAHRVFAFEALKVVFKILLCNIIIIIMHQPFLHSQNFCCYLLWSCYNNRELKLQQLSFFIIKINFLIYCVLYNNEIIEQFMSQ